MNKLFIKACKTLLYSWGGDTPAEVIWGLNEMLRYFEEVNKIEIPGDFQEDDTLGLNEVLLQYIEDL